MSEKFPPDAYLREKLFQPIVNRLRLDPQTAKWSCFRFFAVGITISFAGLAALIMSLPPPPGSAPGYMAGFLVFVVFMAILQIWLQIRRPPAMVLDGIPAVQRVMWIGMCVLFLALAVMNIVSSTASTAGNAIIWGMAASWNAGVAGAYVNVCRRPPPPRTDGARRMAFSGV
jgi:hypothetical protein